METTYTHTIWRVKPGREDDFVERWSEWAEWSREKGLARAALLLRDTESEQTFISFGPWTSIGQARTWRTMAGYQERVSRLTEVLEGFEPRTLHVVVRR